MDDTAKPCLNCSASLMPAQRFCGGCGQRAGRARLTMHDISHDFLHAMFHVDQSIFSLIRELAYRPGQVAREFVEGKRKKYFGPFAFLVLAVGLASFMIVITGVQFFTPVSDSGAAGVLQKHINLVILMQMPLLAGACRFLFWNERLFYAEHLVLAAYTSGFRILVLGLVATPAIAIAHVAPASRAFVPAYFGLWLVYFVFAAVQFYRGSAFWVIVRAGLAAVIGQLLTMTLLSMFVVLFISFATH